MYNVSSKKRRAQVGIGTLVVFIAMVLVASIASGVLINTAGLLQSKSEQTGVESSSLVTNRLTIIGKYGLIGDGGNEIVLDSSNLESHEEDQDTTKKQFTIQSGEKLLVAKQGGSGCSASPYHLVVDGTPSDNKLQNNDQLLVENTSDGRVRFTLLDDDGNVIEEIGTSPSPVSLKVDACDEGEIYFREQEDYESDFLVDETGTAEVRLADHYVDSIDISVQRSPGAGDVDVSDATVIYKGPENVRHLSYTEDNPDERSFTAEPIRGSNVVLASTSDTVEIRLDATALTDGPGLAPGSDVTVYVVTQSGARISIHLDVPNYLSGESVAL